jgi:hypothetical protein
MEARAEESELSGDEIQAYYRIEDILTEPTGGQSFLSQMNPASTRHRTGDAQLDEWYAQLDQGQIPDEFWGPNGKPEKAMSWEEMMTAAQAE